MIVVFHHCGLFITSYMEFLFSWVTNLYILYRPTRKYTYQINNTKLVVGGVTWPPQASWNPPSSMLTSPASLGPWWFSEEDHGELETKIQVLTWILIPLMATPMAGPMSLAAPTLNCQPGNLPPPRSESPDQLRTCPQVGQAYLWKVARMRFESIYSVQNRSQNPSTTRTASIHPRNNICR